MKSIETYFDYASPWAYLASELMPRKLPSLGAAIIYRPIYLRGLASFAKGVPYSRSGRCSPRPSAPPRRPRSRPRACRP